MKGAQTKGTVGEQVPVKCFDVADIKNDAMAFGDGPVIHGLFADDAKDIVCSGSGIQEAGLKVVSDADGGGDCSHIVNPFFRCRFREKDAPKIGVGRLVEL